LNALETWDKVIPQLLQLKRTIIRIPILLLATRIGNQNRPFFPAKIAIPLSEPPYLRSRWPIRPHLSAP